MVISLVLDLHERLFCVARYVINVKDILKISCSSQGDSTFVVHVEQTKEKGKSKGDHLFSCSR